MKRKKRIKYLKMLDKAVELKTIYNIKDENENYGINSSPKILIITLFSILLILSWLSFQWLYEYRYFITIHRYINSHFSIYFPLQVSSIALYILNFIIIVIISIPSNYFIIKTILSLMKKENSIQFDKLPKIIFLPILIYSFLFLLANFIYKSYYSYYYFYFGFLLSLISCFSLLKINIDKRIVNNNYFNLNYENDFIKLFFENFFFEILLGFNIYYLFYVISQIIYYFTSDLLIENYLGIVADIFFGIVCSYINCVLKSIIFSALNIIIYLGIFHFQFTIRREEREEINLGNGEIILSVIFMVCYLFESIYIILY